MKRLRVLVSAYACNPLATERSYPGEAHLGWNLVQQLSCAHDLHVLTESYNRPALENMIRSKKIANARFHYVTLPSYFNFFLNNFLGIRLYYLFWQVAAFFYARRLCQNNSFDIFHQITFNNDWMPSFIGAFMDVPFVWGPVGGGQKIPRHLYGELSLKHRWLERIRNFGQWFWRSAYFRNRCARRASAILVCNSETKSLFVKYNTHIYFFPVNGISREEVSRETQKAEKGGSFTVLYAGRLDGIKAMTIGLKAFKKFSADFSRSRLLIIGDGPEEKRLRKLAKELNVDLATHFYHWMDRKGLLNKMRKADVFLFPSLRDGGGQVVVEAMASGLPVICMELGGPAFHIQEGWGFKIKPGPIEQIIGEMTEALRRLYLSPRLKQRLGRKARQRSEFYFWDKLGRRLLQIYDQVVG